MLRIAFGCMLVFVAAFAQASDKEHSLNHQEQRLRAITVQIDDVDLALRESKQRLDSITSELHNAQEQLAKTRQQLNNAREANSSSMQSSDTVTLQEAHITAEFDRERERVQRLQEREAASRGMVAKVETILRSLRTEQGRILQSIDRNKPAAGYTAQREPQRPAATETSPPAPRAASVAIRQHSEPPVAWPYLSSATEQEIRYARNRLAPLIRRKQQGSAPQGPLKEVAVVNRHSFGEQTMEYLGDNLYSLTTMVHAGRQQFILFNFRFWHTIPNEDDKKQYRMIFDVSSLSNPSFHLFQESLLTSDSELTATP